MLIALLLLSGNIAKADNSAAENTEEILSIDQEITQPQRRNLASDRSNGDFDNCKGDLNEGSCDLNCGGDDDCSSDLKEKWKNREFSCLYEGASDGIVSASEGFDDVATLSDLQNGLGIFSSKLTSFGCVLPTLQFESRDFVEKTFTVETSSDFTKEAAEAEDNFSTPLQITTENTTNLYTLGDNVYINSNEKFKLPSSNSFGVCEETRAVKFLQHRNSTSGSRLMTYGGCSSTTMVPSFTLLPTIISQGSTSITATSDTTWSVATDKIIDKAFAFPATNAIATNSNPGGTTGDCTCTNVPKEIHYTAYTSGGNQITSVNVDTVFEASITGLGADTLSYEQTYSLTFKESTNSRVQSGSPGYKKGFPILAGTQLTSGTQISIKAKEQGFQLYGAQDDGTCILNTVTNFDADSYNYYNDPYLVFGDGALYGGKSSFTAADLATFCTTQTSQVALINNLKTNLVKVGIYGNSNPHFTLDWIDVEYVSSLETTAAWVGGTTNTCTWNGAYSLKIYYTRLGVDENPQYKITRVRLVPERVVWKYTELVSTTLQDFNFQLSVSFHEAPQDLVDFSPKPPNRLPKLSRNVLYPFRIYDD